MKWHRYTKDFAKVDAENNINYKDFLASYRISITEYASSFVSTLFLLCLRARRLDCNLHSRRQTYRQYETLLVETCAKLYSALADFTVVFRAKDTANTGTAM